MRRLILEWMYACHILVIGQNTAWRSGTHLRGFDVVVEVVAESLNMRNNVRHPLGRQVSREEN